MVEIEIRGKKFPLCLTVAAVDEVCAKCGSLNGIGDFLDGKEPNYMIAPGDAEPQPTEDSFGRQLVNSAWLLALLIREGEENRLAVARLDGEPVQRQEVPDRDTLLHLLTARSAAGYRPAVMKAVYESLHKEIEAEYPKNVKDVEQA